MNAITFAPGGLYPVSIVAPDGTRLYSIIATHGTLDPIAAGNHARSANCAPELHHALGVLTDTAVKLLRNGDTPPPFIDLENATASAVRALNLWGTIAPTKAAELIVPPFNTVCDSDRGNAAQPLPHLGCGARFWTDNPAERLCPSCRAHTHA